MEIETQPVYAGTLRIENIKFHSRSSHYFTRNNTLHHTTIQFFTFLLFRLFLFLFFFFILVLLPVLVFLVLFLFIQLRVAVSTIQRQAVQSLAFPSLYERRMSRLSFPLHDSSPSDFRSAALSSPVLGDLVQCDLPASSVVLIFRNSVFCPSPDRHLIDTVHGWNPYDPSETPPVAAAKLRV